MLNNNLLVLHANLFPYNGGDFCGIHCPQDKNSLTPNNANFFNIVEKRRVAKVKLFQKALILDSNTHVRMSLFQNQPLGLSTASWNLKLMGGENRTNLGLSRGHISVAMVILIIPVKKE